MTRVGNDVVDLRHPRCRGKSRDRRFLERVFSFEEALVICQAGDPDRALWRAWASKEAAFKVVSKLMGDPPPFEHAAFRFREDSSGSPAGSPREPSTPMSAGSTPASPPPTWSPGSITYRGTEIPVRLEERADRVHVLAWHTGSDQAPTIHSEVKFLPELEHEHGPQWEKGLEPRFSKREWRSVHRPDSALVRLNARSHLARVLGVEEGIVEIVSDEGPPGRMPPRVLLDGEEWSGDLSLSHHGRFLAWAFTQGDP